MDPLRVTKKKQRKKKTRLESALLSLAARRILTNVSHNVFPDEGITNDVLHNFLTILCSEDYLGVFNINNLPHEITQEDNFHMVLNTHKHFVVLFVTPKEIVYIDPVGNPPPSGQFNRELQAFIKDTKRRSNGPNRKLIISDREIQAANSTFCGLYCMLFMLFFDHRLTKPRLKFTSTPSMQNDKKCVSYLLKIVNNL